MKIATIAAVALIALAPAAHGQDTYKKDIPAALAKQAKITEHAAAESATQRVPKGKIEAVELENEDGKLLYSYDIKTAGKSGIDEVHIDAMTGKVIGVVHETPAMEKKEAAADAKEVKAKAKSAKP
ncbi:MAG: PepSY domain-containing protein [bacterium]